MGPFKKLLIDILIITHLAAFLLIVFPIQLKPTNEIIDLSSVDYSSLIVEAGLEVLDIEGVKVTVVDINRPLTLDGEDKPILTEAYITNPYEGAYTIFINPHNTKEDLVTIFAHELIHLKQYHEGRLKRLSNNTLIFQSDTLTLKNDRYLERPWEIEAFGKQGPLSREIQKKV
jgi:hypothetical protein